MDMFAYRFIVSGLVAITNVATGSNFVLIARVDAVT
jgi:hypothetical protein